MESADERIAQLAAEMADKQVKEEDEVSKLLKGQTHEKHKELVTTIHQQSIACLQLNASAYSLIVAFLKTEKLDQFR